MGSSVTEAAWQDEIPTDRPALVLAEGLPMYLAPDGVAPWVKTVAGLQRCAGPTPASAGG
ncbi:MAG: hypothetical protein QOI78_9550 [Actinomycetota bacterium]|nr:hypothetical protein [Actinomycetota bacterium]